MIKNPNEHSMLRENAETLITCAPLKGASVYSADELEHELQVHQIELEMQNEELRRAYHALEESRACYVNLYELAPTGYITLTHDGLISEINLTGATLLGEERKNLINRRFASLIAPKDSDYWYLLFKDMIQSTEEAHNFELSLQRSDNSICHVLLHCLLVTTDDKSLLVRIMLTDITERKRTELDLRIAATAFETQDSIAITDTSGVIVKINKAFTRMTGYSEREVVGQKISILKSGRQDVIFYTAMWESITRLGAWQGEIWDQRKNGEIYPNWLSISAVKENGGEVTHYVATHVDITERKQAEAEKQSLTQLYAALSQCNQAIVRCSNEGELFMQICREVVTFGGMKMAWIGLLQQNQIKAVASYGKGTDYLKDIQISTNEYEAAGRGPTGIAMREDHPYWCQDFQHDPATALWHERGIRFGWGASAALPLHRNGIVVGSFTLYSSQIDAFDQAARDLLVEMAMDIDYALNNFEREAQRKQAESSLLEAYSMLKTIIDTAPVRIFWKDKQLRYLGCNPAFAADVGEINTQAVIGKDDYQLGWNAQEERYRADDQKVIDSGLAKLFYEETQTTSDGSMIYLRSSKVPLRNEANETIGVLGIYDDITEQKQTEEQIHYLANFDPLTGLPNRSQLDEHLKYALSLAKRSNGHLALLFLDLDHFKDINDTLGHSVGDVLLIELAKRLRLLLREEDTVTRLGGDEFILLLPGVDALGAAHVAQKLLDAIADPYRIKLFDLILTASVGIALYPEDGLDLETLSKSADAAMYQAKQEGRQCYRFFTPEMQARSLRNLQLLNALRHALESKQLSIHYQPQVAIPTGQIIGTEALLRWQHPEYGMVSPAEFIPIAESSGLILPIGEWVLRCAVQQAKAWMDKGFAPMIMAVNLSAVQFRHPDLPELVTRILAEAGLPAAYLELELTEGVAMHNPLGAIAVMNNLHARGIRMSIDDFGTGYSSLSYLKKFKVYKLKIDQSFVRDISTDPEDKAIVSAIINLSKSLGLKTIAEGVETKEQLAFLSEQGCDEIQGYLFSKPVPAEQLEILLKRTL